MTSPAGKLVALGLFYSEKRAKRTHVEKASFSTADDIVLWIDKLAITPSEIYDRYLLYVNNPTPGGLGAAWYLAFPEKTTVRQALDQTVKEIHKNKAALGVSGGLYVDKKYVLQLSALGFDLKPAWPSPGKKPAPGRVEITTVGSGGSVLAWGEIQEKLIKV